MSLRKDIDKLLKIQAEDDKILGRIWDRIYALEAANTDQDRRLKVFEGTLVTHNLQIQELKNQKYAPAYTSFTSPTSKLDIHSGVRETLDRINSLESKLSSLNLKVATIEATSSPLANVDSKRLDTCFLSLATKSEQISKLETNARRFDASLYSLSSKIDACHSLIQNKAIKDHCRSLETKNCSSWVHCKGCHSYD